VGKSELSRQSSIKVTLDNPMANTDYGSIIIRGARENNLKSVSLDIPKRRITVFTGVSGSGKSSLVFSTIAAESQRLINETYPAFVQQFMPHYGQPDADKLENISAAIIVDQQRLGGNLRSTVATVTDTAQMLRVLFSRLAKPHLPAPGYYSYNDPRGMCPECEGVGQVSAIDMTAVVDESKSLSQGALLHKVFAVHGWWWDIYARSGMFDLDKPIRKYSKEERANLFDLDDGRKVRVDKINLTYLGVVPKLRQMMGDKDPETLQPHVRVEYDRIFTRKICPACNGARLKAEALASKISGKNIAEFSSMQVSDLAALVRNLKAPQAAPMLAALAARLENLVTIGLGYLSLDRESSSLSGGESQRVKMVRHLGSSLTDITYVFDEPSVGLHPHDVGRMAGLMQQLRDKGNTVLIVEHKPDMIAIADHVVDMGPLAGSKGGEVVYQGDFAGLLTSGTLTGNHMKRHQPIKDKVRTPSSTISRTSPPPSPKACSPPFQASPARANHRSSWAACLWHFLKPSSSIRISPAVPAAPTPPPTPAFSTTCVRPLPRPTRSMRRCSPPIPRARVLTAAGSALSTPTSATSTPWPPPARPAKASASCLRCLCTACAARPSATSTR